MDKQSRLFFDVYHGFERDLDRDAAWCLVQLLRTANGHEPLDGPEITPAEVLHL